MNDEDDVPWADPQIQEDYEAALGAFLVRFNRIENTVSDIIYHVLKRHNRLDLVDGPLKLPLQQRLTTLELLLLPYRSIPPVPYREILALSHERNALAHGHFDQNPFQGDYQIVGRGKVSTFLPESLEQLARKADGLWDRLRAAEASFMFDEVED